MLTSRGANLDLSGADVDDIALAGADHLYLTGHPVLDGDDDARVAGPARPSGTGRRTSLGGAGLGRDASGLRRPAVP